MHILLHFYVHIHEQQAAKPAKREKKIRSSLQNCIFLLYILFNYT